MMNMEVNDYSREHEALINIAKLTIDEKIWSYVERVLSYAYTLALQEKADKDIVVAAALFYQIVSYPYDDIRMFRACDESAKFAVNLLESIEFFPQKKIAHVADVIRQNSYTVHGLHDSIESKVLHDAIIFASFEKTYTRGYKKVNDQPGMLRMIAHEKSKRASMRK